MAQLVSALEQRLSKACGNFRNFYLHSDDSDRGQATRVIFDLLRLLKHPLKKENLKIKLMQRHTNPKNEVI
jgi:hypothetical protein